MAAGERPHIFVTSGIVELPFGNGRRFGTNMTGIGDLRVGGWQPGLFYRVQSGNPIGFMNWRAPNTTCAAIHASSRLRMSAILAWCAGSAARLRVSWGSATTS